MKDSTKKVIIAELLKFAVSVSADLKMSHEDSMAVANSILGMILIVDKSKNLIEATSNAKEFGGDLSIPMMVSTIGHLINTLDKSLDKKHQPRGLLELEPHAKN